MAKKPPEALVTRDDLLAEVERRTEQHERVLELARITTEASAVDRARAIKRALAAAPGKEVAEAAGVSVQRMYQIVKTLETGK